MMNTYETTFGSEINNITKITLTQNYAVAEFCVSGIFF